MTSAAPASAATEYAAARLERAHYQLQRGLYFTEAVSLPGATAFFSAGITEPEWNHGSLLRAEDPSGTLVVLKQIESLFEARGLAAAVEIGPAASAPGLAKLFEDRGYERRYCYSWLVADQPAAALRDEAAAPGIEVRAVQSRSEAQAFFDVLQSAYSEELESGYSRAFEQLESSSPEADVAHYLAWSGSKPVAVGSSLRGIAGEASGVTGLYNLAVHPKWRGRGLGLLLTRLRLREARHRGHLALMQTERKALDSWRRRLGFQLAFRTEGWVRITSPQQD